MSEARLAERAGPSRRATADPQRSLFGGVAAAVAALTLVPLGFLVWQSVRTTGAADAAFTLAHLRAATEGLADAGLLAHSLVFATGTALFALASGALLAWLNERALPSVRPLGFALALVPLAIPGVLFAVAWMLLASPRTGLLNVALRALTGSDGVFVDVHSLGGMVFVAGLHHAPLAFLLMTAALRAVDPALEEAARLCGADPLRVAARITLPLAAPAMLAALLLVFVRAIESFEIPALIGLPAGIGVLTTAVFEAAQHSRGEPGLASAYAIALLALAGTALLAHARATRAAERYATTPGPRASRARGRGALVATTGLVAWVVVIAALPLATLAWTSLQPWHRAPGADALATVGLEAYRRLLDTPAIARATGNSLALAFASATLVALLGGLVAWLATRSRIRGRAWLDALATVPVAMPGIVIGLALMVVHLTVPTGLYGTLAILLVAYWTRFLPYGTRYASAALLQTDRRFEEAAQTSGAGWPTTLRRIVLPLVAPWLAAGWLYVFIASVRELSSSILLYGPGTEVLSVVLWELWDNGQHAELAALGVLMVTGLLGLALAAQALAPRLSRPLP